jgi:hypothetical protein
MTTKLIVLILGYWPIAQLWADPPELLRVIRNVQDVEPGRWYADAKIGVNVLGMRAVAGLDETWLMEMHDTFASIEDVDQALASVRPVINSKASADLASGDVLSPARSLIALYRPALSYRPDEAAKNLSKAHYLLISIYRILPGSEDVFSETIKLRRVRSDSINLDRPEIAYEVIAGGVRHFPHSRSWMMGLPRRRLMPKALGTRARKLRLRRASVRNECSCESTVV